MSASPDAAASDTPATGFSTAAVLEAVAAGAALAGWVAVVGGTHMWARLDAAHFEPSTSVAFQPREALFVEGAKALLLPLLLAAFGAILVWYWWSPAPIAKETPDDDFETRFQRWLRTPEGRRLTAEWWATPRDPQKLDPLTDLRGLFAHIQIYGPLRPGGERRHRRERLGNWFLQYRGRLDWTVTSLVALLFLVLLIYYITERFHGVWILWTVLLTAAATLAGLLALPNSRTRRGRALLLFGLVALWAGASDFMLVAGTKHPKFELALVVRKSDHSSVAGFFVANRGGDVYLAKRLEQKKGFRVLVIPKADVASFSFGPSRQVGTGSALKSEQLKRTVFAGEVAQASTTTKVVTTGDNHAPQTFVTVTAPLTVNVPTAPPPIVTVNVPTAPSPTVAVKVPSTPPPHVTVTVPASGSSPSDRFAPTATIALPACHLGESAVNCRLRRGAAASWNRLSGLVINPSSGSPVRGVEISVVRIGSRACAAYVGFRFADLSCSEAYRVWLPATVAHKRWTMKLPELEPGQYAIRVRASDASGNQQHPPAVRLLSLR
jgi:hypothetical protein